MLNLSCLSCSENAGTAAVSQGHYRLPCCTLGVCLLLSKPLHPPECCLPPGCLMPALPPPQIVVAGLLPTVHEGVRPDAVRDTNTAYSALAQRQGAAYVACGQDLDPSDTGLFGDGLHPAGVGQDLFLSCLRVATQPYFAA